MKMSKEVFKACKKYKDEVDPFAPKNGRCRGGKGLTRWLLQVVILRLDCSEHPDLAKKLGASRLPLFLVYEDGQQVDRYGA